MKALASFAMVTAALAAKISQHYSNMGLDLSATPAIAADNSTGAYCGVGYTYCGYILKEQKNFDEATILTAYCAGGYCDAGNGSTDTDPMQGLYVCLPESAIPKRNKQDDEPYTGPVKIELLCACNGKAFGGGDNVCLNPDGDHIGRCSTPCSNSASS
ncbi:hypothetical protein M406DRAFT_67397 [Cryphonectria parasitica EP155]|uniref:Uncharacterized protein n=1 Tax=Cryphonectria parasitica (strain ATCC 38755 / EP155) TaxID=660469 RepID=A0A9P5CV27_CRYP1|nr:uncharacterized protein M406DRAFT_67397 [Cryphonectria parasitica EP155]KAF3771062.1 hypothetical protein M406DRAFT_67397 [Cryphonectria parasitica EP155]